MGERGAHHCTVNENSAMPSISYKTFKSISLSRRKNSAQSYYIIQRHSSYTSSPFDSSASIQFSNGARILTANWLIKPCRICSINRDEICFITSNEQNVNSVCTFLRSHVHNRNIVLKVAISLSVLFAPSQCAQYVFRFISSKIVTESIWLHSMVVTVLCQFGRLRIRLLLLLLYLLLYCNSFVFPSGFMFACISFRLAFVMIL